MRQNKKPIPRKTAVTQDTAPGKSSRRRNSWEPQVIVPHQVDLALTVQERDEVAVPAAPTGRSLINGRR